MFLSDTDNSRKNEKMYLMREVGYQNHKEQMTNVNRESKP